MLLPFSVWVLHASYLVVGHTTQVTSLLVDLKESGQTISVSGGASMLSQRARKQQKRSGVDTSKAELSLGDVAKSFLDDVTMARRARTRKARNFFIVSKVLGCWVTWWF